jgi:hypothetical protein
MGEGQVKRTALLLVGLMAATGSALASEVRVGSLLADPESFAGLEITVSGELIGDFMRRDRSVWAQLNDDSYADSPASAGGQLTGYNQGVAVRFPSALFDAGEFERPGGYRVRGPVVRVTGEWRYHDEERGGESYLDAVSFEVLERELTFEEDAPLGVLMLGMAILLTAGSGALVMRRRAKNASRRPA